jgi:hypothetical protein
MLAHNLTVITEKIEAREFCPMQKERDE